ncbi:unnamed protein product [Caenorhabditis brenneri]
MSTEQDIKTEEQIPLTDAVAVPIVVEGDAAAAVAPEEPKPKKNWFTWGKKKGSAVINETNVEEGAVEDEEPKKEKKESWWKACTKTQPITIDRDQRMGINFVDRDRNNLATNLDFSFENVFGENKAQHSWEWSYRINHYVYSAFKEIFYKLFQWCVLPFTVFFAIFVALFVTLYSWILLPLGKLLIIPGTVVAAVWSWLIHAIFDPIFASLGLLFSNFNIRKYGINQENTAPCV